MSFLNTRPLVHGLEDAEPLFDVEFDLPSTCAARLHDGDVDLGLIPAIEYLHGDYRLVPGHGHRLRRPDPVGGDLHHAADRAGASGWPLDTSSRTSVALTRILCAQATGASRRCSCRRRRTCEPMLASADAALVIGDPALAIDPARAGVEKIDLGAAWRALTGLPFVYAAWAGRAGALDAGARGGAGRGARAGLAARDAIAAPSCRRRPAARPRRWPHTCVIISATGSAIASRPASSGSSSWRSRWDHPAAPRPLRFFA